MILQSSIDLLKRWTPLWPLLLPLGLALGTQLGFPPQFDDEEPHLHFSEYLARHPTWHTLATYDGSEHFEAKAPFVFVLGAIVGTVAGFSLPPMRLLILLFGLAAIHYARRLVQLAASDDPWLRASGLVLVPYFLILSLTFMTDMPNLALLLMASYHLFVSVERNSVGHLACSILASTAMLYNRIDGAVVLAGIGIAYASRGRLPRFALIGILVPLLLRLPLVIVWGGLAAPPAQARPIPVEAGLAPAYLAFSLCAVGLHFFPFALDGLTRRPGIRVISTLLALALFFAFTPRFEPSNAERLGGILRSLILAATPADGPRRTLALAFLLVIGCQVLINCCWPLPGEPLLVRFLEITCILGIAMQSLRGAVMYERYLFVVFGFLYLLIVYRRVRRWPLYVWVVIMLLFQFVQLYQHHLI